MKQFRNKKNYNISKIRKIGITAYALITATAFPINGSYNWWRNLLMKINYLDTWKMKI